MQKWFAITFWVAVFGAVAWYSVYRLPPQHNPFAPLSVEDPLGLSTATKLARMKSDPVRCFGYLDESDVRYSRLEDTSPEASCGFHDALTLDRSLLPYSVTLQMTCPLTAALATWERQSLIPAASEFLSAPPVEVMSYGSYACRRKYDLSSGSFSEHATGNAIDIKGIRFADGTRISVKAHWGKSSPEGRFLTALRDNACDIFGTVLGPEYNDAHADHFHFDMSPSGICS